ncbi:PH domain-containing protein [Mucilaginibacter paludis]|uniref:Uncharacterized protein n=1 Tax=Mucilaginibacter paludis DSM 18603 TaxID=714943 RepID=H1Y1U7_9SPHI|nr:PH domain-containing protein [Mucilaginibacter paludis]EHQ25650.1 hypothetical protein Mucpa_1492 [Mucilaginibacter paludis DSM 18603]
MLNLDFEAEKQLGPELIGNEKLVWAGRPKKGIVFRAIDIFIIPFSAIWLGGFIWMTTSSNDFNSMPFRLFQIPFYAAGLFMLFGRFIWDSMMRANTVYGLTENRVIIKSGIFSTKTQSYYIKSIPQINIREKSEGRGTIELNKGGFLSGVGMRGNWEPPIPQLELIENARDVYNTILKLQHS